MCPGSFIEPRILSGEVWGHSISHYFIAIPVAFFAEATAANFTEALRVGSLKIAQRLDYVGIVR